MKKIGEVPVLFLTFEKERKENVIFQPRSTQIISVKQELESEVEAYIDTFNKHQILKIEI